MKKFLPIILLILFWTVGCGQTKVNVVDSATGQPVPNPSYHGKTIGDKLTFTYHYEASYTVKDLDGSTHQYPNYLDKRTNSIERKEVTSLKLILTIFNPTGMEYRVFAARSYTYTNGVPRFQDYRQEAASHLPYREYVFQMPVDTKFKKVSLNVTVTDKKNSSLFRTGRFQYSLL